ncbi:hypothetical protein [Clostridium gasigenes]|uniref:Uncharacterized protein n=1 Tax=Clostridium gasigenes TaxID=94869 RepID=A0A1H0T423_9CLOT|nr:hypothetical protein [Clostridium gasigenes]MBB6623765.1 hypothetical protein [Clostridium gasigenes]MBU3088896.1 hypothetical protein [Clostridium gasigenes]SDP48852.1 hypothetical protein SAMN04488529_10660 [Clostridium gasigenes]
MKVIIYINTVILAVVVNMLSLIMYIYLIKEGNVVFIMFLVLIGVVNRQIIDNGKNLNKKKKTIIYSSFFLMLAIGLAYGTYYYKINI